MPARVLSFPDVAPKTGEYSLIVSALPARGEETVGVLLLDPKSDTLHLRLRRDWERLASEEDAEVLAEIEDDLRMQALDEGGRAVFERLEREISNSLRVTDRESVSVRDFDKTLNELYRQHVAAGPFLSNREDIRAEEWLETPRDLNLDDDMFIARIQGHSMEPRIPDGSLCVFRRNVVGSRNGRLVLVRNSELADDNQYTVKRYKSEKRADEEGFVQTRICLESLNPAYPSWDLDEDAEKYRVVAEFVRVLE
jgi:phage repressor protein C with HTH and peptisase S24 domain